MVFVENEELNSTSVDYLIKYTFRVNDDLDNDIEFKERENLFDKIV